MASVISQSSDDSMLAVIAILIAILLITSYEDLLARISISNPRLAFAIDIAANIFLLMLIAILRALFLDYIFSSTILAFIYYGLCLLALFSAARLILNMILLIGFYCSRNMPRLMQLVYDKMKFLAVRIGVITPDDDYAILRYRMDIEMGYCDGACTICLMEFEEGEECALLQKCDHLFHHVCLYDWLAISSRCRTCRRSTKDCEREELDVATTATSSYNQMYQIGPHEIC